MSSSTSDSLRFSLFDEIFTRFQGFVETRVILRATGNRHQVLVGITRQNNTNKPLPALLLCLPFSRNNMEHERRHACDADGYLECPPGGRAGSMSHRRARRSVHKVGRSHTRPFPQEFILWYGGRDAVSTTFVEVTCDRCHTVCTQQRRILCDENKLHGEMRNFVFWLGQREDAAQSRISGYCERVGSKKIPTRILTGP